MNGYINVSGNDTKHQINFKDAKVLAIIMGILFKWRIYRNPKNKNVNRGYYLHNLGSRTTFTIPNPQFSKWTVGVPYYSGKTSASV